MILLRNLIVFSADLDNTDVVIFVEDGLNTLHSGFSDVFG